MDQGSFEGNCYMKRKIKFSRTKSKNKDQNYLSKRLEEMLRSTNSFHLSKKNHTSKNMNMKRKK